MDNHVNAQEIAYTIHSEDQMITLEWIQKHFAAVIEDMNADEAVIAGHFTTDYTQHVDGKTMGYADFVQHMKAQKAAIRSAKITIERCMIQGNSFFTVHRVNAVKKNGDAIVARVIGYFEVKDGKISFCDELTKLLVGSKEDEDLGSRK